MFFLAGSTHGGGFVTRLLDQVAGEELAQCWREDRVGHSVARPGAKFVVDDSRPGENGKVRECLAGARAFG